ncbi:baseplate wedge subunit [Rhizobium phage RHEph06]|uniref:Putative structural protein n=2 Tax=Kleczkowskavirus RHEph4 TaxID=1921526 RepID=L7TJM2_9CAUD|nr:baseplate wedge subunit [Rhizobium phage RHEph06]YP_009598474.1 baseplate wedge subunit [Rhizobium phage RHEph04]AGC35794.1 putative structural protein [Rhizobium phage RHEph05]QXV74911.1 baseplate assembly protein W [Rhizobium phage RHEph26]AGC35718.1 putative structural protein [Rhizobium phage RHEph04]AGC35875.1 putative structural protein [Rhizobium phage RHEph06]
MSNHFGLAIDPTTNDLFLDSTHSLAVVQDAAAVGQHVRQRLMTFYGEWFLDTEAGVKWLAQIMGKAYDPALAEAVVKAEVFDTDGVTGIDGFDIGYIKDLRKLDIKGIQVSTVYDEEVSV